MTQNAGNDSGVSRFVVRGALAESIDNPDDAYRRVVLVPTGTDDVDTTAVLGLGDLAADSAPDTLRAEICEQVSVFVAQHGTLPAFVDVPGAGTRLQIVRENMEPLFPLRGKIAVVTGAAGAIGAGICRGLLAQGCRVAATDLAQDNLDSLVTELGGDVPDRIMGVGMDVTDEGSVATAFAETAATWGGVDIVIVNAGIAHVAFLVDMDPADFRRLEAPPRSLPRHRSRGATSAFDSGCRNRRRSAGRHRRP